MSARYATLFADDDNNVVGREYSNGVACSVYDPEYIVCISRRNGSKPTFI